MKFSENSRVWIYQANREFSQDELAVIELMLTRFTDDWTAHDKQLMATAEVRYNRFVILVVDENQAGASGCSIDKSVKLMKTFEERFNVNLFDRFNMAYRDAAGIKAVGRFEFEALIEQGIVTDDTIVFNNLVSNLADLDSKWEVPFKNSWHPQVFKLPVAVK